MQETLGELHVFTRTSEFPKLSQMFVSRHGNTHVNFYYEVIVHCTGHHYHVNGMVRFAGVKTITENNDNKKTYCLTAAGYQTCSLLVRLF